MCGIIGFIGKPVDPEVTFDLINQLMIKTEVRGEHATGFWTSTDKKIIYHKEPVKSSVFVNNDIWSEFGKMSPDLFIGHCRWTTPGGGPEKVNKNNHPHVSKDRRVALVHNGKIPEYHHLKKKYLTKSECDSEVLLRIFESAEDYHDQKELLQKELPKIWEDTPQDLMYRLFGLKKIFSEVNYGAMAVAIAERLEGEGRSLFLFRNEYRPITLIDLRDTLGQIFFCSTPEIFRAAIDDAPSANLIVPRDQGVLQLPESWIYSFVFDGKDTQIRRIKVNKTRKYGYWDSATDEDEDALPKSSGKINRARIDVLTKLNDDEEPVVNRMLPVVYQNQSFLSGIYTNNGINHDDLEDDIDNGRILRREEPISDSFLGKRRGFQEVVRSTHENDEDGEEEDDNKLAKDPEVFVNLCKRARDFLDEISTSVYNSVREGSMTQQELNDLIDTMEETVSDLESTKHILKIG